MSNIGYHPLANVDLNDAMDYYEDSQEGLGFDFLLQVQSKIGVIVQYPERYPKRRGHYRVTRIEIYPYLITYRYNKQKHLITISSIQHAHRNPKHKYRK